MTWRERVNPLRRIRPWLYLTAITLAMGMLVGADALTNSHGADKAKSEPPRAGGGKIVGPVVMGTVDTNPQPVHYGGLPSVLSSGTIKKVNVREGTKVKAGDILYEFDTASLEPALESANRAVDSARIQVLEAKEKAKLHISQIEIAESLMPDAVENVRKYEDLCNLITTNLKDDYRDRRNTPPAEWDRLLMNDDRLFEAKVKLFKSKTELHAKQGELKSLKDQTEYFGLAIKKAEAGVKQAEAERDRAQTAIDLCTIKAKIGGTIEQISISPGVTLGISSVKPALWLIPEGPRIVRGEIEAEFAHKITPSIIGKEVTIYDNTNPKLTYRGKVYYISDSFLLKRSNSEGFPGSDTRVLEALIEVTDSTQADKAPLRVGQRVRVDLGD